MDSRYIITIDGGTTNTRAFLWENDHVIGRHKEETGVRDTAVDGNNRRLKYAVKKCIQTLIEKRELVYSDVSRIIASGMITSDVGLVELPHITVPAGIEELAVATHSVMLEDICPLPISFIPGIKNRCEEIDYDNYEVMDIMRGEETESVGLIQKFGNSKPMVLMLPGSHAKMISVNKDGKITGCMTSMSGELLSIITNHTILADALDKRFVDEEHYDRESVLRGYQNTKKVGFNRACFSARILNQFVTKDSWEIANYLLGAVLWNDVYGLKHTGAVHIPCNEYIVIAGKFSLRQGLADILKDDGYYNNVQVYSEPDDISLSAIGARLVAEYGSTKIV